MQAQHESEGRHSCAEAAGCSAACGSRARPLLLIIWLLLLLLPCLLCPRLRSTISHSSCDCKVWSHASGSLTQSHPSGQPLGGR